MEKVVLNCSIGIKEGLPTLCLKDKDGAVLIGSCFYLSIEDLAREYQKDFEYNNKKKGQYQYFVIMEGQGDEVQLFQRPILQGYGEPNKYIDETNKIS